MKSREVYLSNLEWTKLHGDVGGVKALLVFKDAMTYEEYEKLLKKKYFMLKDKHEKR